MRLEANFSLWGGGEFLATVTKVVFVFRFRYHKCAHYVLL